MKGTEIINDAKDRLKDFIAYELGLLYSAKGWQDEGYNAFGDMYFEFDNEITFDVWVSDCEGNDYIEQRNIERLVTNEKDNTFFIEVEDAREYYFSEIDVDTLAKIANIIETEYKRAINK